MQTLEIKNDTWFKQTDKKQAAKLDEANKVHVSAGKQIAITKIFPLHDKDNHLKFWLEDPLKGKITWFAYIGDLDLDDLEIDHEEETPKTNPEPSGTIWTPGQTINWNDFSCHVTANFTVGEFLQHDRQRIPTNKAVQDKIILIAKQLELIRTDWGSAIGLTSGYRPPAVNRRIGGASRSRHIQGDAVDVYPYNREFRRFEQFLDKNWFGALGYGVASKRGFTHLDCRNGKGWKTGGSKGVRWYY